MTGPSLYRLDCGGLFTILVICTSAVFWTLGRYNLRTGTNNVRVLLAQILYESQKNVSHLYPKKRVKNVGTIHKWVQLKANSSNEFTVVLLEK